MRLSYAQNLEDYHLDLVFPEGRGTYVDVGGGHPVADNVSFWFYLRGWRGLVVEPQDELARLYAGVRPRDHVVACLAGAQDGEAVLQQVDGLHGLSSMVAANAARAREFASVRPVTRRVARLSALIEEAGLAGPIDFLKIDVEGAEADVIAGLDFARHRPKVIVVEALSPANMAADTSAFEPQLVAAGYVPSLFDNVNRFYVAGEHAALAARLPGKPAQWDQVAHLWDCGRAGERADHPDRRLAEVLAAGLYAELSLLPPDLVARLLERGLAARAAKAASGDRAEAWATLLGSAEWPGPADAGLATESLAGLVETDRFRAALGRIACMYDGGHIVE